MKIQELLDNFKITQQELADFTGIPRTSIAKWVQLGKEPPKIGDATKIKQAVNFFTGKSTEEIKKSVNEFRIVLNNVIRKDEINNLQPGIVSELVEPYGNKSVNTSENNNKSSILTPHKTNEDMYTQLERMLGILEKSQESMYLLAHAQAKMAEASLADADTRNRLSKLLDVQYSKTVAS